MREWGKNRYRRKLVVLVLIVRFIRGLRYTSGTNF